MQDPIFAQKKTMIQRIQSIFLLLASGSCFGIFGTDAADSPAPVEASRLFADASFDVFDSPVLIACFALAGVLLLADIFLFKNRPLQSKISAGALFVVGLGVGYGIYLFFSNDIPANVTPDLGIGLPVLAVVFGTLASRYIKADEKLVRSADRLR